MTPKEYILPSGERIKYDALHSRLRRSNGNAKYCSHCDGKNAKRFEWALIKGRKYSLDISDYIPLCPSCHRHYDKCYGNIGERSKKKVVDISNNKEYNSLKEASIDLGINYQTLKNYFRPNRNNKTNLRWKQD